MQTPSNANSKIKFILKITQKPSLAKFLYWNKNKSRTTYKRLISNSIYKNGKGMHRQFIKTIIKKFKTPI